MSTKLDPANPYVDVVVHTLWALIMALVLGTAGELRQPVARLMDEDEVSAQSRRELEAVAYALRMAGRG
ncbi:hypothetical protein ACIBG8_26565 [Nonomuraea sp. NPDC050556]|uniref:hypothetical protein n=1 Tax=Nonomuraea sp. NPDC050556 TaxID=3364369 RepID=UPI003799BC04